MSFLSHTVDKPFLSLLIKNFIHVKSAYNKSRNICSHSRLIQSNSCHNYIITRFSNTNSNSSTISICPNINRSADSNMTEKPFLPKRVLVLRKFSRLEFERLCHPNQTEEQLAIGLSQRGSNYESLKNSDRIHKASLQKIESVLAASNIEYETVDRFGYTEDKVDWADVVITSGGDGTFLTAASKITARDKPVIGINSDPTKSVGSLCLPSYYSNNFDKVIESLKKGKFQWTYKQRLRVTLVGDAADENPRDLNDIRINMRCMSSFLDQDRDESQDRITTVTSRSRLHEFTHQLLPRKEDDPARTKVFRVPDVTVPRPTRQLKERALNEVFIGEILSARVSYYELSVDNNRMVKLKSSGLTVCTGTGSTSWYYNINKLTEQQVKSIIGIANTVTSSSSISPGDEKIVSDITKKFNEGLTFSPTESIMAYSIRDPVDNSHEMSHSHRGFAKRVEVKSRMQDACLVLDGGQFYPFNDGSYVVIEMHDEDALKTISLDLR